MYFLARSVMVKNSQESGIFFMQKSNFLGGILNFREIPRITRLVSESTSMSLSTLNSELTMPTYDYMYISKYSMEIGRNHIRFYKRSFRPGSSKFIRIQADMHYIAFPKVANTLWGIFQRVANSF